MWQFTGNQRPSFAQEPREGQESVWDYPRPPVCQADSREIIVRNGDVEIARTNKSIRILETASPPTFYLPVADVAMEFMKQVSGTSICEWKGAATYWSVKTPGATLPNSAWSYESPSKPFLSIAGFISFYPAILDCYVDGEKVRPQPGGFYGGWVTNEIIGPYKGEPGTGGW